MGSNKTKRRVETKKLVRLKRLTTSNNLFGTLKDDI